MNRKKKKIITKLSEAEKEKIINELLPYIKYTALRLAWRLPPQLTIEDLLSAGIVGLLEAIERFDEDQGKISTFAKHRIKGAMIDELDKFNPVSKYQRQKEKMINEPCGNKEKCNGRLHNYDENTETLNLPIEDHYESLNSSPFIGILSIDGMAEKHANGLEDTLAEVIPDKSLISPSEEYEENSKKLIIASIIDELPEKEKLILSLYYWDELTMKEISRVMDMSEGRVCQLHKKALLWMKERLKSDNRIKDFL